MVCFVSPSLQYVSVVLSFNALCIHVVYGSIDQTLVNSLHGLLNFERDGLDCRVITTEYETCVHCIHM